MVRTVVPILVGVSAMAVVGVMAYSSAESSDERSDLGQALRASYNSKDAKKAREKAQKEQDAFYEQRGGEEVCADPDYSKNTLKAAISPRPFAGLFTNLRGQRKFEASDIIRVNRNGADQFYVVFDNLYSIGRVEASATVHDSRNALIGTPGVDSGYEAIVYDNITDTFFVTVEALTVDNAMRLHKGDKPSDKKSDGPFVGVVRELKLPTEGSEPDSKPLSCPVAYAFPSENKGFEGMFLHRTGPAHDDLYLLGLCEGNHCAGGKEGRDAGNGKIIVLHWRSDKSEDAKPPKALKGASCWWEPVSEINIPSEVKFLDYSAIAYRPQNSQVAIASQENAAVWVGDIDLKGDNPKKWEIKKDGKLLHFPRDGSCRITNCNVEGITWVGENVLAAVSDKMKSGGRQDYRCLAADQSFQQFVLP